MNRVNNTVGAHQPIEYRQGFADGSDSGYAAAGNPYYSYNKDAKRYLNDDLYHTGWDDGFTYQKSKCESARRAMKK